MLDRKVYWYVLFVRAGSEEKLSERLKETLGEGHLPFVPQKTFIFRRQGQKSLIKKICFPGYVFIESSISAQAFMEHIFPIVYKQKDAYRFLSYADRHEITMREEERIELCKIFGNEHCLDIAHGFKEGDSVRIISGALEGYESKIVSININRHEAIIDVTMFGTKVLVSIGLEIIDKTSNVAERKLQVVS